jgi:hypothetical protein
MATGNVCVDDSGGKEEVTRGWKNCIMRSFISHKLVFARHFSDNQTKEDEMGMT